MPVQCLAEALGLPGARHQAVTPGVDSGVKPLKRMRSCAASQTRAFPRRPWGSGALLLLRSRSFHPRFMTASGAVMKTGRALGPEEGEEEEENPG